MKKATIYCLLLTAGFFKMDWIYHQYDNWQFLCLKNLLYCMFKSKILKSC
jgi:hypothetical protein